MKRIAFVSQGLSSGGAERVASILANSFAKMGDKVLFIAAYSPEKIYELNENVEYKYIDLKNKNKIIKFLERSKKIKSELEKFSPDIVISFLINDMFYSNLTIKSPIIYSLRNDPNNMFNKIADRIVCEISYRRAKKIVFQTEGAKNYFGKSIAKKGVIIGNPLTGNLPYWIEQEHEKKIITACRITPQKNLKMLIDAFYKLNQINKEYILEIYGNGPLQKELEEYCLKLKIEKYVKFLGHSKNIHEIMAKASIFALTSNFEGLSNSMLEALAIGIPTVCTDCPPGGASLYIKDEENGMLVEVNNVEQLYTKFEKIINDEELCKKMSKNSIRIREKLSEENIVNKWNETIENL